MTKVTKSICILCSMHPPHDNRVFDKVAVTLADAGYQVTLIAPSAVSLPESSHGVRLRRIGRRGAHIARNRSAMRSVLALLRRFGTLVRLFLVGYRQRADVYHCNEPDSWLVGLTLKAVLGCRVVFDIHELYPTRLSEVVSLPFRRPLYILARKIFDILSLFTDEILLVHDGLVNEYRDLRCPMVTVANYPVLSPRQFTRGMRSAGTYCIAFLGRLSADRGAMEILAAVSEVSITTDCRLLVIGQVVDNPGEFWNAVHEFGLMDRVEVTGWLEEGVARERLVEANVGIIALHETGNWKASLPRKLFDYMAHGLPVIAPDFPHIREVVQDVRCGILVEPGQWRPLKEAVLQLVNDPEVAQSMGERGRQSVLCKYNWQREADKLLDVYASILGENLCSVSALGHEL